MALLLRFPSGVGKISEFITKDMINDNKGRVLYTALTEYFNAREERTIEAFLAQDVEVLKEIRDYIDEIFMVDVPDNDDDLKREFFTTALHLKRQWLKSAIVDSMRAMKQAQFSGDAHEVARFSAQISELIEQSRKIESTSTPFSL